MRLPHPRCFSLLLAAPFAAPAPAQDDGPPPGRIRFATFNVALNRAGAGELVAELEGGRSAQAHAVAEIVQRVRPDVLLLNELDHDEEGRALESFRARYLAVAHGDAAGIDYPYAFTAPVNTGEPSGLDLDGDGRRDGPGDAFGFGTFPGQYGMAVLSRHPIREGDVRTFRMLRWRDVPDSRLPADHYGEQASERLRLSSKSHQDVPIEVAGRTIHFLVSHPTPPVFDGPEDRNGRRNADEIRFWADYVEPARAAWIRDDDGRAGGLAAGAAFVIAGDLNADPEDGEASDAIARLLDHPRIDARFPPASEGGVAAARVQGGANAAHRGDPRHDTADFADDGPGNLRVDYVLPSRGLVHAGSGVFWPGPEDPLHARLVGVGRAPVSSDHRLVWVDVEVPDGDAGEGLAGQPFGALGSMRFLGGFSFADHELTLLRWWTSGCPFCADSLPALDALRRRHEADGLAVVGVFHPKPVRAVSDEQVRRAAAAVGFGGVLAVDPRWEKLRELWQRGAPQEATSISVLVDRAGKVVWVHQGPRLHGSEAGEHPGAARDYRALEELVRARTR